MKVRYSLSKHMSKVALGAMQLDSIHASLLSVPYQCPRAFYWHTESMKKAKVN